MTTDITTIIADLRAKAEAATPGPWESTNEKPYMVRTEIPSNRDPMWKDWITTCHTIPEPSLSIPTTQKNAAFIAAANPRVVMGLLNLLEYHRKGADDLANMTRCDWKKDEAEILKGMGL